MATTVRETIPIKVGREVQGGERRRTLWWTVAVLLALAVGLVAGAAGWQATRSDTTAATRDLAQRYVAAGFWSPAQAAMFTANGKFVSAATGASAQGHQAINSIETTFRHRHFAGEQTKETMVFAGPTGFVTEWTVKGPTSPDTGRPFTIHGVSVSTVSNGQITLQTIYYDPAGLHGVALP